MTAKQAEEEDGLSLGNVGTGELEVGQGARGHRRAD